MNGVYADQLEKVLSNGKYQYLNKELPKRAQCSSSEIAGLFRSLNLGRMVTFGKVKLFTTGPNRKGKAVEPLSLHLKKFDVILASSGMCDNGPSSAYLPLLEDDPRNTIVLTGFQAGGSAGRKLLQDSGSGAEIVDLSSHYSGHGDQQKLLDNIFDLGGYPPKSRGTTVFINHGEPQSKEAFKEKILELNSQEMPGKRKIRQALIANDDWFDLDADAYIPGTESLTRVEIEEEIERLKQLLPTA